jgi:hypothetical protein
MEKLKTKGVGQECPTHTATADGQRLNPQMPP